MMVNMRWLKHWVGTRATSDELVDKLTMAGLEVDSVEAVAPDLRKVVVGEVLETSPHPKADRLKVCLTNTGRARPVSIVCGAANVRAGMKVAVAQIGARLPNGTQIGKSRIRDVVSSGMLCSSQELGLDDDGSGILELDPDAKVGLPLTEHLLFDDETLDVELTPNRGDCLSVAGIARETAVLTSTRFKEIAIKDIAPQHKSRVGVALKAPADCPRYLARVIENVDLSARTPDWMRERLRRCGLRSISAAVDITNYVMLELGQPLHAFDADKLDGPIQVRRALNKESLELLDGKNVVLNDTMLVIADQSKAVALAGIMGGAATAVSDTTTRILLEAAHFTPNVIAGRARRLGMQTDASFRFERGVDPELPLKAQTRATQLYMEICGGSPGPVVEGINKKHLRKPASITLRHDRLERIIGHTYTRSQVEKALTGLGMALRSNKAGWTVTAPTRRFDIEKEHDLIEEVVRINGYDAVPIAMPATQVCARNQQEESVSLATMRQHLMGAGYQEAITYSFVDRDLQSALYPAIKPIPLANPIASNMSVMRVSLLPGLLDAVQSNMNRQHRHIRLFETGHVFLGTRKKPKEVNRIALVASGGRDVSQWWNNDEPLDYFDIKGDVERLLEATGRRTDFVFEADTHSSMHPGQCARIVVRNKTVGHVGLLHPAIQSQREIAQSVFLAEIDIDAVRRSRLPKYEPTSRFPSTRRDLAVLVASETPVQTVLNTVQKEAGVNLRYLELFDVYRGKGIDSSLKSVAFGLTLQHSSRTLTDGEVEGLMERVLSALKTTHDAQLRG